MKWNDEPQRRASDKKKLERPGWPLRVNENREKANA